MESRKVEGGRKILEAGISYSFNPRSDDHKN
jgi:hypothetical protein